MMLRNESFLFLRFLQAKFEGGVATGGGDGVVEELSAV